MKRAGSEVAAYRFAWILGIIGVLFATSAMAWPENFIPDWREQSNWPYPIAPGTMPDPVLTRSDVTDVRAAFVADPFLMRKDGVWYLFFEVYAWPGVISVATSMDGLDWTYDRVVLDEARHLSYPCVFGYENPVSGVTEYYMTVESGATKTVPLYKATAFPYGWQLVSVLASGREFADPTIFRWDHTWWMFVSRANSDVCYLYYSDSLEQGWREHPQSPIARGRGVSRPAGRVMVVDGSRILRLAQDCDPHYGEAVRVFNVDTMTRTTYSEHEIEDSPIVTASGQGWNAAGMHQCDEWWTGNRWLAAVDGLANGRWSIEIYARGREADAVWPADSPLPSLRVYPNPLPAGRELHLVWDRPGAVETSGLEITDVSGRFIGRLSNASQSGGGPASASWIPRDREGRALSPGVYFLRAGASSDHVQIVVTR